MSVSAFQGTPRFEILARLGAGGMGVVFEAFDLDRKARIALKLLPRSEGSLLYLFKQEFRALADVAHPNLVTLHELIEHQGDWFFTMELVDGVDFLRFVRGSMSAQPPTLLENNTTATFVLDPRRTRPFVFEGGEDTPIEGSPDPFAQQPRSSPLATREQFERLRAALAGLSEGLQALHGAGKLHRDIKPSNVLVTRTGRVVLLDFGLVQDRAAPNEEGEIAGTLAYMAPEQAAGKTLTPAGDWYAVGVILFQALTGRLPFETLGRRLLAEKQNLDAPLVSSIAPTAPPDLAHLCQQLLQRVPDLRPTGAQVRELLGGATSDQALPGDEFLSSSIFIGRTEQLARLRAAVELSRSQTVVVFVHGRSGVGKTWLMQHFLDDWLAHDQQAVLLTGRCYERESVPYKALDGLVDSLSRYLRRRPVQETQPLLSADVPYLARLFPVLRNVPAIAGIEPVAEIVDPHELRRRAFAALRELLARLGWRRRLVLCIDDLQWGDLDSADLLAELVAPPDAPRLCLFYSYRREYAATSACLRSLLEGGSRKQAGQARHELPVEPLEPAEARQLAQTLLGGGQVLATEEEAASIARESEGGPYFIRELVHYFRQGKRQSIGVPGRATLDQVLGERVGDLAAPARQLLEVVTMAGRPIRQREALQAANIGGADLSALRRLHADHLIRGTGAGAQDEIEVYHDRIREIVNQRLGATARAELHGRLAQVLEQAGDADPETLAIHFQESGDRARAGIYYVQAAVQASGALAFDRAARLYRLALETRAPQGEAARDLYAGLARSLADAGRGPEAGEAYCAAADVTDGQPAIILRMEAARHFLLSGHVERGLDVLRSVLHAVGLTFPRTKAQAVVNLLWRSLWLRSRKLSFRSRDSIPADELLRLDVCIMAGGSLGYYDLLRSLHFSLRAAHLALATGEPGRVVEALAVLAMAEAGGGGRSRRRTDRLIAAAQAACDRSPTPYLQGLMDCVRGEADYLCGDYPKGLLHCTRAEATFRERCTGREHNLAFSRTYILLSHLFMGNLAELARLAPALVGDAQERGDSSFVAMHRAFVLPFLALAADEPQRADATVKQALVDWGGRESHVIQTLALLGGINTSLYAGRVDDAWKSVGGQWQSWKLSLNAFVQSASIEMHSLRARCALATHVLEPQPSLLRVAEHSARKLEAEGMPRCEPLANLIRAALAHERGEQTAADALLEGARAAFDRESMHLHAAVVRRRQGELLENGAGKQRIAEADAWMASQGIKNPARMTALLAPGFAEQAL